MANTYRIAVIGRTGRGDYGHGLDTAWLSIPNAQIVAVADDDKPGLAAAARRLKVERTFVDYRQMLDEAKPDVVAIAPRWVDRHAEMAIAAAERGVHIYMEKPLCRTLAEADQMVQACEKTHVKLAVAHPTRYSPRLAAVQKLIAEQKLGKVLEYRARGKEDRRGGGEDLWVLGSHVLEMIRTLAGLPTWCSANVTQNGLPISASHVAEGAEGLGPLAGDAVHAMYGLPDGATAYFSSVRNAAGRASRYGLQVFGSTGVVDIVEGTLPPVKFSPDPSWSSGRSGARWQDVTSAGIGEPEPHSGARYTSRHTLAIEDLFDAIENNRQPLCSIYQARDVVEMIAAVFESQRLGRPVELPLENRENPLRSLPA